MNFSDYIVFVDESGDHGIEQIDSTYPIFVLACCIFDKDTYLRKLVPSLHSFMCGHFGHDSVILHERDIRKGSGDFALLHDLSRKEKFLEELTEILRSTSFTLIAAVIDKRAMRERGRDDGDLYHLSLKFCLERIRFFLRGKQQLDRLTHIVCEARGAREDRALELEFRRICNGENYRRHKMPFDIVISDKRANSAGLQLADLMARPIGMRVFRPEQSNRTFDVLDQKFDRSAVGKIDGFGLKRFP